MKAMISFDKTVINNIYRVHSTQFQWDKAVVIFQEQLKLNYQLIILYADTTNLVVKQGSRKVGKHSIVAKRAELELLGTKEENPEYFL